MNCGKLLVKWHMIAENALDYSAQLMEFHIFIEYVFLATL